MKNIGLLVVLALLFVGCARGADYPTPMPSLDEASARAIERVYPRGDGTHWCLVERDCGSEVGVTFNTMKFTLSYDDRTRNRPPLCLDLVPCRELPEQP